MANACRDFVCPYGGTLAEVIDKTPKDRISKVLLEEKVFYKQLPAGRAKKPCHLHDLCNNFDMCSLVWFTLSLRLLFFDCLFLTLFFSPCAYLSSFVFFVVSSLIFFDWR